MKRVTIEEAFAKAPLSGPQGPAGAAGGEAVVLSVRGGEIIAVVPAGTPEDGVIAAACNVRAALRLDNERVLTFEIHEGAASAYFRDEPAQLRAQRREPSAAAPTLPDFLAGLGKAEDVMTPTVLTASPDELVEDIAKRLVFHNVTGLPVEDWDGKVIGIVSEVDVIDKIGQTVGDIMSADVVTVAKDTPLAQIAALLTERRIKRVPVVDEGALVGIVSRADIVRVFAARAGELA